MDGDLGRVADHFLVDVDVCGPEVYEDVHDEHDVHDQVHHVQGRAGVAALPPLLLLDVVEEEGSRVGGEDGRVDDQQQDEPVPHCFEGTVVKDGPLVHARGLELVLGQHVCTQRENLRTGDREFINLIGGLISLMYSLRYSAFNHNQYYIFERKKMCNLTVFAV